MDMKFPRQVMMTALFTLCFALFTMSGIAQTTTTGSIEGTIVDANGAAVPGVTVTVTSPNLLASQSGTTNEQGLYRVPNLPPGRYNVVIEATGGFSRFEQPNVEVSLSKTSTVAVQLQPQGASTTVDVSASSGGAIDVTTNTTGSSISTELFSNIPNQRTITSLYSIAPTVSRSGLRDASGRDRDPSVGGSSGPENNYILDGVNTSDPAFGGSGANLPFEFVQEVEVKTGAFGAEYGLSTGGIFNVITKTGGNEFHGDVFGYFTGRGLVAATKNFPFTGSAPNGFSEADAGVDVGGPIIKNKLTFFGAFNPQRRKNGFFTQTFRQQVENKITTPFYAGKLLYQINPNNSLTFSTFGDFTKQTGFLFGNTGFGADPNSFRGQILTGGSNYTLRLNSAFKSNFIGEFAFGLHRQRANTSADPSVANAPLTFDTFAILRRDGTVAPVTQSGINFGSNTGFVDFVNAPGGSLQRNFTRSGFGIVANNQRNRIEAQARLQNIYGKSTTKYGFEFFRNTYNIANRRTGPATSFANPSGGAFTNFSGGNTAAGVNGFQVQNNFSVCTTRGNQIVCPSSAAAARAALIATSAGFPGGAIQGTITTAEANNNPFLVRVTSRVRDFELNAQTHTNVESFYVQEEYKVNRRLQLNGGLRADYQQAYGNNGQAYLKLNKFIDNLQPRVGFTFDPTGQGRSKLFINYARFVETPIPLDINVRAGSENSQTDKNFLVDRLNAGPGAVIVPGIRPGGVSAVNLGAAPTPIDFDLKPQDVNETTAGFEYEVRRNLSVGVRGVYRAQDTVIEDGSFDGGDNYFLFNPGESLTERNARLLDVPFGRARRYYRALEFTATKRFSNNYQFIASYVRSSLIGNYEGLFRNDNGQSDPNITSLFDLPNLLNNQYGRLPNDRPNQFKFDGSYTTPFRALVVGSSFRAQSGIPYDQLIPDAVYGNNEGFQVQRGTAINPITGKNRTPFTTNLDLNAYFPIKFGEKRQLRLQADFFNVFNTQRAIRQDTTFTINSGVTGIAPIANPFFGQGTIFQFPFSVRLGAKFQF